MNIHETKEAILNKLANLSKEDECIAHWLVINWVIVLALTIPFLLSTDYSAFTWERAVTGFLYLLEFGLTVAGVLIGFAIAITITCWWLFERNQPKEYFWK